MSTKIGFIGSHGVGKTTLLIEFVGKLIRENIDFYTITDTARKCPHRINKESNFQSQLWIFREQTRQEHNFNNGKVLLSDRTVLDIIAYSQYAMNNNMMSRDEFEILKTLVKDWSEINPYLFVYVPIPEGLEIEDDGVRDTDKEYQMTIDTYIKKILDDLKLNYITLENNGKEEETFKKLISLIKK
jgi:GTPase SAR1 family protein